MDTKNGGLRNDIKNAIIHVNLSGTQKKDHLNLFIRLKFPGIRKGVRAL